MPKEISGSNEAKEGLKGQEFVPEKNGVDFVPTAKGVLTVVRGLIDGKPMAMLLQPGITMQSLLGINNEAKLDQESILDRLGDAIGSMRRNPLVTWVTAAYAAASLSACNKPAQHSKEPAAAVSEYGVRTAALTMNQVQNVGKGQPIPWSTPSDDAPNKGEMDGEKYMTIGGKYVKCSAWEDCIKNGVPQNIQGLDALAAVDVLPPFYDSAVFQDKDGSYKAIINDGGTGMQGEAVKDANGKLLFKNMVKIPNGKMASGVSVFQINGVPHALYMDVDLNKQVKRNLWTGADEVVKNTNFVDFCGTGTFDEQVAVGSRYSKNLNGVEFCKLVVSSTLEGLGLNPLYLNSLNNAGSNTLRDPRVFGPYLVYMRFDVPPGGTDPESKLWYSLTAPTPADADATGDTSPDVDAGSGTDAAQDGTDSDTGPAAPDADAAAQVDGSTDATADAAADVLAGTDANSNDADADSGPAAPDAQDGTDAADSGPATPDAQEPDSPDTSPLDLGPNCAPIPEFNLTVGNCTVNVCPEAGTINGHTVDISGDGKNVCKADVTLDGKPVTLTISNDQNGVITAKCELVPGYPLNCDPGLNTSVKVDEKGAGTKLKGDGIELGSEASSFTMTPRDSNTYEVVSFNKPDEPKVVIKFTDGKTIEVSSDGLTYVVDTKTQNIILKDKPDQDAGNNDADASNADAQSQGPDSADAVGADLAAQIDAILKQETGSQDGGKGGDWSSSEVSQDASQPSISPRPPDTSCNARGLSQTNPKLFALVMAAVGLVFAARRRKNHS